MKTTVIGGGVIGLACAFELAQRGVEVTVVEASTVGAGASAGNAGWITPFLSTPRAAPGAIGDAARAMTQPGGPARIRPHLTPSFARWTLRFLLASRPGAHRHGVEALQRLARTAVPAFDRLGERGVRFDEYRDGLAVVALTERNVDHYTQLATTMRRAGYAGDVQVLRGADVQAFDPAIRRDVAGVVHLVDERHVRPETVTRGLADALVASGGRVVEHARVESLRRHGAQWVVGVTGGEDITCDSVVVAAGFASRQVLALVDVDLPLESARGTSITAVGDGVPPTHALKLSEHMVACSPFGDRVRLSGAFDVGVRHSRVDRRRLDAVVANGLRYLESWRPSRVEIEWAGHRPTSPDDLPIIGPVPGRTGLYVATGHGTLGVTLGPATGALVARELADGSPQDLLTPFRLTRFARRRHAQPALPPVLGES
jgi:D-amino-acid dehydrogenase